MLLNEEQSKLRALVTEAIAVLCRNGLSYQNEVSVEGLLGITTDNQDVFLISLNEIIRHEAQIDEHETYTSINTAQRISNTHRPGPLSSKNRKRSHSTATVGSQPPIESDSLPFDITPVSSVNAAEPPSKRSSSPAAIDSNNEKTNTTNAEHTVTEPKPAGEELKKDSKPQVEILTENVKTESVEAQVESHGDTNNEETTHMNNVESRQPAVNVVRCDPLLKDEETSPVSVSNVARRTWPEISPELETQRDKDTQSTTGSKHNLVESITGSGIPIIEKTETPRQASSELRFISGDGGGTAIVTTGASYDKTGLTVSTAIPVVTSSDKSSPGTLSTQSGDKYALNTSTAVTSLLINPLVRNFRSIQQSTPGETIGKKIRDLLKEGIVQSTETPTVQKGESSYGLLRDLLKDNQQPLGVDREKQALSLSDSGATRIDPKPGRENSSAETAVSRDYPDLTLSSSNSQQHNKLTELHDSISALEHFTGRIYRGPTDDTVFSSASKNPVEATGTQAPVHTDLPSLPSAISHTSHRGHTHGLLVSAKPDATSTGPLQDSPIFSGPRFPVSHASTSQVVDLPSVADQSHPVSESCPKVSQAISSAAIFSLPSTAPRPGARTPTRTHRQPRRRVPFRPLPRPPLYRGQPLPAPPPFNPPKTSSQLVPIAQIEGQMSQATLLHSAGGSVKVGKSVLETLPIGSQLGEFGRYPAMPPPWSPSSIAHSGPPPLIGPAFPMSSSAGSPMSPRRGRSPTPGREGPGQSPYRKTKSRRRRKESTGSAPGTPLAPQSPASSLASYYDPGTPFGPDTPLGPGTPLGPSTPLGPGTPYRPETPCGPGTPLGPDAPFGPKTPYGSDVDYSPSPQASYGPRTPQGPVTLLPIHGPSTPQGPTSPYGQFGPNTPQRSVTPHLLYGPGTSQWLFGPGTPQAPGTPYGSHGPSTPQTPRSETSSHGSVQEEFPPDSRPLPSPRDISGIPGHLLPPVRGHDTSRPQEPSTDSNHNKKGPLGIYEEESLRSYVAYDREPVGYYGNTPYHRDESDAEALDLSKPS